ncbi:DUF934 domain-containing protein [Thalassovita sp.]|uniref:DUF934 domain-containing protein n=1 Tax=Thalassovita sp. TaxID=1979401 RepID=UPI002881444B|nr:DUF934 domain-containing protein [Thalassovita sp.]MDF1803918.1 DUF934 domain-containing protein [Thalassovita sp.]
MSVIVTDKGFGPDDWTGGFTALGEAANDVLSIDLGSDADPETLADRLPALQMIRVDFPSFADGRGFTLARRLRLMGYTGRLRANGHVISDQYAMARRSGFDEVEISDELAARQPADEWVFRANWQSNDYQSRVRAG